MTKGGADPPGESSPMAGEETAGAVYGELIRDELAEERADKATLEQRGVMIGSTSTVAASLLLAVLTATGRNEPPGRAKVFLVVALLMLALAALLGTLTNLLRRVTKVPVGELRRLSEPKFSEGRRGIGEQRVRERRLDALDEIRTANDVKAILVMIAMALEGIGVVVLVTGVLLALGG